MSARAEKFTFQTRPTPAQNEAMVKANRDRQYRDNVDEAIADMQVARLRYEERQPEPCQFCAVEEEAPVTLPEFVLLTAKGLVCIACWLAFGLAVLWLCDVAGQYFGSHV